MHRGRVSSILFAIIIAMVSNIEAKEKMSELELVKYFPPGEVATITKVAQEYQLSEVETRILFSIRKTENGGAGLEFGVGQNFPNHPARRFKNNPEKSLRLQAQWAAGTIKKRYRGNLQELAVRYCERPDHWFKMVSHWMEKLA